MCDFGYAQVELQVRKMHCVSRAVPTLPINIEDAARSEIEIEKALQVRHSISVSVFGLV